MSIQFSVLMSVYYKEKPEFLDVCFASLLQQKLQADEIILVLDGPLTQELNDVIASWKIKLPIKTIALEKNVGLGKALQIGLEACSFSFVARMDTDDIALPDRFLQQVEFVRMNPQIDLVGGNISEFIYSDKDAHAIRTVPESGEKIRSFAKYKSPFNHMTVFFKKNAVLTVGGYQHHQFMEDYNLWLRLIANNAQLANIPKVMVKARVSKEMYGRRSGITYFKSEYVLYLLKCQLNLANKYSGFFIFLVRGFIRFLPVWMLSYVYKLNRKSLKVANSSQE